MESESQQALSIFKSRRLPSLDALRFLAALLVILGHGGLGLPAGDGVTYFFVLSGLLFSWMFQKEWADTGTIDFKSFYLRRTFRIVPALYVAILFTIVAKNVLSLPVNYAHALSAATFTGNYYNAFHGHPPTGFDIYWSLGVEEQFYLLWPLCFVFFMKRGMRALVTFLIAAIVMVCSWRTVLALGYRIGSPYLYNAFDTRFDSLALGCLLGLLVMNPRASSFFYRATKTGLEPLLTISAIVLLTNIPPWIHYSIGLTAEAAFMALLIAQLVILHDHRLWRWLNHSSMKFLGTLSYSIYLYHNWGLAIGGKFKMYPLECRVGVGLLAALVLASLSYYVIEEPFTKLRKRYE